MRVSRGWGTREYAVDRGRVCMWTAECVHHDNKISFSCTRAARLASALFRPMLEPCGNTRTLATKIIFARTLNSYNPTHSLRLTVVLIHALLYRFSSFQSRLILRFPFFFFVTLWNRLICFWRFINMTSFLSIDQTRWSSISLFVVHLILLKTFKTKNRMNFLNGLIVTVCLVQSYFDPWSRAWN